jgi:DNA-binding GntR family transcriptional regulator
MKKLEKLIAPSSLTERAQLSIRRYILEGSFDAESRLTEDFFARHLGISKSPVREALNTLQSEGLIRIEPRRGVYLRRFSAKEIEDLYELREALEVFAAAVAKITPQLLEELDESVARTRRHLEADEKIAHIEEDIHFHGLIVSSTGNSELQRVFSNIQNKLWLCRCQSYGLTSTGTPLAHSEIAGALREHDRTRAEELLRRHIRMVRRALLASMQEGIDEEKELALCE